MPSLVKHRVQCHHDKRQSGDNSDSASAHCGRGWTVAACSRCSGRGRRDIGKDLVALSVVAPGRRHEGANEVIANRRSFAIAAPVP
jgi:hypothetical protein